MPISRRCGGSAGCCAVEEDVARAGRHEAGDHAQRRGLAAAGRTEQHDHLAGRDVEADGVDRGVCRRSACSARSSDSAAASVIAPPGPDGRSGRAAAAARPTATICATATAATIGSMWYSRYCSTATGSVVTPGLVRNSAISRFSNEMTKANSAPAMMPGRIAGRVTRQITVERAARRGWPRLPRRRGRGW